MGCLSPYNMEIRNLKLLNNKEVKKIKEILNDQFGILDFPQWTWFQNNEQKICVISKEIERIDVQGLRINNLGCYIAKQEPHFLRLTMEGAQYLGPKAKKNIIIIEDKSDWMKGVDIASSLDQGAVIIKYQNDFLGSGYSAKGIIKNYVPKERRLE